MNSEADNDELKELVVKAGRLAGAAALQGHNVDAGKKLLLGALVAARQLQLKAEEARCLRWVAMKFFTKYFHGKGPIVCAFERMRLGLANWQIDIAVVYESCISNAQEW